MQCDALLMFNMQINLQYRIIYKDFGGQKQVSQVWISNTLNPV